MKSFRTILFLGLALVLSGFSMVDASRLPEKFVPLVAVPGYLASSLSWSGPDYNGCQGSSEPQNWWFDVEPIIFDHECLKYHVSVNYNFDKPVFENIPSVSTVSGASIHVAGATGFQASDYNMGSPYFITVKENLKALGYTPCDEPDMDYCDFAVASWVWPYAPASYYDSFDGDENQPLFAAIRSHVEKIYEMTGEKVALLAHSEGGMSLTHFLIEQPAEWKDKYVAHAIFIAPAFATWETTYAPLVGLIGSYQVPDWVPQFIITDITKTWPGNLIMLPNDFLYPNDTEVLFIGDKVVTLGELNQMYEEYAPAGIAEAHKLIRNYVLRAKDHPGVKAYVYSGSQQPTSFQYDMHMEWFSDYFSGATVRSYTDGDGTLPLRAVRTYAEHWMKNTSYYTNYTDVPYMIHSNFIGTNPGNMAWINRLCKVEPCVGVENANNLCPAGFACSTYSMKACSASNEYSPAVGATECTLIPDGFFKVSDTKIEECSVGYACTGGIRTPCKAGFHTNGAGQSQCISNSGMFLSDNGIWEICPAGYFCNGKKFACPVGTASKTVGASKASACYPCPVGKFASAGSESCVDCDALNVYQDEEGSGSCKAVPAGYYKVSANSIAICPINAYCYNGYKYECPHPSYNPLVGQSDIYACNYCADDQYAKNDYPNCYPIPDGYYKVGAKIEECHAGNYCINGKMMPCEAGKYQSKPGQSTCLSIPNGYIVSDHQLVACPAGGYCINGKFIKCENNMYQPSTGASECIECPLMGYTNSEHNECLPCPAHSVCDGTPNIHECSKNEVVKNGLCTPCEWYQFADSYYHKCVDVWDGFYYIKHRHLEPQPCEEGFYCLHNIKKPCPSGYWSVGGSAECYKM